MSSCETLRHYTNAMVPFSGAPLNLTSLPHYLEVGDLAGDFSHGARGGRARALIGQGVQLPRTLLQPLGWSGSAQSPYQAGLPTDPPIVLAVRVCVFVCVCMCVIALPYFMRCVSSKTAHSFICMTKYT